MDMFNNDMYFLYEIPCIAMYHHQVCDKFGFKPEYCGAPYFFKFTQNLRFV